MYWENIPVCLVSYYCCWCTVGKFDHVTPVFRDVFHWLPVHQRIQLKIALLLTVSAALIQHIFGTSAFHWQPVKHLFGSTWRRRCATVTDQNSARSSKLSHCSISLLECPSCLPPINIHQSKTILGLVENQSLQPMTSSENIFVLRVCCTYLLTYLFTACPSPRPRGSARRKTATSLILRGHF